MFTQREHFSTEKFRFFRYNKQNVFINRPIQCVYNTKNGGFTVENLLKSVHTKCISSCKKICYNIITVKDRTSPEPTDSLTSTTPQSRMHTADGSSYRTIFCGNRLKLCPQVQDVAVCSLFVCIQLFFGIKYG